jgi:hypothetical protein
MLGRLPFEVWPDFVSEIDFPGRPSLGGLPWADFPGRASLGGLPWADFPGQASPDRLPWYFPGQTSLVLPLNIMYSLHLYFPATSLLLPRYFPATSPGKFFFE